MECNKEEASRAKDVSERKLHEADFPGAKKMAVKAHQLFPGLENISQLLAVCEVHCSSSVKINGETDWYGILQVEPTADDMVLKKQYRKLALLLHPDKNKFAGAEAAFKLIGEAYMTLTDHVKRSSHDNKRKAVFATSAPMPKKRARASKKTDPAHKKDNKENFGAPQTQKSPQQQAGKSSGLSSFWTICLTCGTKYQYPCSSLMRFVLCRICSRSFLAYDLSKKSVPAGVDTAYPWSGVGMQPQKFPPSQQAHVTNQGQNNQSFPGWQHPLTGHQTHPAHQQQQSQNVPNQQTAAANQQQHSQRRPPSAGSKNAMSSEGVGDPNKGATDSTKVSRAPSRKQNGAGRTESPYAQQSQDVPNQQTPTDDQRQQSQRRPTSAVPTNVMSSEGLGDPNSKEATESTKVSSAAFKEKDGADRTELPFVSSAKLSPTNMQKRAIQSQHFPSQQTSPVIQQVQSQKPSFNEGSINLNSMGMSDSNARTCTNIPRASLNKENGSSRTESPLANSDKVSPANMGKGIMKDANGAVKTGQNPQRSSQQENNVSNEDGSGGCGKGSDNIHDSPVAKRIRKGYSSSNADMNGGTVHEDGNVYTTQACSIPITKTPNENVEVVNGLDEKQGASKKEEMRNSGRDGVASSVVNRIPCEGGVSYPDPEFYDFEENRNATQFKADQIWAVYDDSDSMPRYYARIKQVHQNFMLWFSWLEFDPLNDAEKAWYSKDMPVACGRFRIGKTILTEDRKMFSHVVSWTKGKKRNSYEIYPVKGEVWALLRICDINQSSGSSDHKNYSYDVVEIKSDFAVGIGTYVTPLVKVKGFVSLFVRSDKEEPYLIPGGDTLRFSHNIPFHRLSEADKPHIPNGALELDPASMPSNMEEASSSADLNRSSTQEGNIGGNVSSTRDSFKCEMPVSKTKEGLDSAATNEGNVHNGVKKPNINADGKHDNGSEASVIDAHTVDQWDDSFQSESPATFVYPEPEFFNFGDIRSFDNFKSGQIWALYCETDKFPKYYAFIKKVDQDDLTIHIRWLEYCPCGEMEKRLVQNGLSASCGIFRVSSQSDNYDCTSVFSHIMEVTTVSKGKKYEILPRVGQVWAVYKNWNRGWSFENFKSCEYDLVEVLEISAASLTLSYLTKVDGFSTVFMLERKGESASVVKILRSDMMMFSHQIPSYRMTNEGDKLCGYWELDPASVPETFLARKTK
ncbi:hypothetical protein ACQJBY_000429 [Aegilops geniculata]